MLAHAKPEYFLLTDSKHSIHFDHLVKLSLKSWTAQIGIYFTSAIKMKIGIDSLIHASLICIQRWDWWKCFRCKVTISEWYQQPNRLNPSSIGGKHHKETLPQ